MTQNKKRHQNLILILAGIFLLMFTTCENDNDNNNNGNGTKTAITFTVTQIGGTSNTADSTGLSFTFSSAIDELNVTANDITLTGAAEKGSAAFTGSGVTWTLSPITVNSQGSVTVKITKDGITSETRSAAVHKAVSGTECEDCSDPECDGEKCKEPPVCQPGGPDCGNPDCPIHGNTNPGCGAEGCTDPGCNGECQVIEGGVAINRDHSTSTSFVFSVNPVNGATVYKVYNGEEVLASSASPTNISVSQGLTDRALTPLTVKAENAVGAVLWDANLQGMLKYPAATPTKDGYTDWFRFLDAGLSTLRSMDHQDYDPHVTLRTDVRAALNAGQPADEDAGKWYKERDEGRCNNAMAAVLANYQEIMENATEINVETMNETIFRLWFNKVTSPATNDPVLNNMMKVEFPNSIIN